MTDNKVLYEIIVGEDNRKMVKIAQWGLQNLWFLYKVVRLIKSRRMKCVTEHRMQSTFCLIIPRKKTIWKNFISKWEVKIELDLREIGCKIGNRLNLLIRFIGELGWWQCNFVLHNDKLLNEDPENWVISQSSMQRTHIYWSLLFSQLMIYVEVTTVTCLV
jgi:hypothetical protein